MSYDLPTPPASLPTDLVNTLNELDPERFHDLATYAGELAEHEECEARLEEEVDRDEVEERLDEVPAKATITIRDIDGNRYEY